jgi:hypothetical protein
MVVVTFVPNRLSLPAHAVHWSPGMFQYRRRPVNAAVAAQKAQTLSALRFLAARTYKNSSARVAAAREVISAWS